ncbi:hypothetical protein BD413DRAFT_16667 [Trametes elegans]|nr:hypothetical protein BD413DRAFT_16667 [Trametes elegans]
MQRQSAELEKRRRMKQRSETTATAGVGSGLGERGGGDRRRRRRCSGHARRLPPLFVHPTTGCVGSPLPPSPASEPLPYNSPAAVSITVLAAAHDVHELLLGVLARSSPPLPVPDSPGEPRRAPSRQRRPQRAPNSAREASVKQFANTDLCHMPYGAKTTDLSTLCLGRRAHRHPSPPSRDTHAAAGI